MFQLHMRPACAIVIAATLVAGAPEMRSDLAAELAALIQRFQEEQERFLKQVQTTQDAEKRMELFKSAPWDPLVLQFRAIAEKAKGTDTAIEAWTWTVRVAGAAGQGAVVRTAVDTIAAEGMRSSALVGAVSVIGEMTHSLGTTPVEGFLRKVIAESPDPKAQGVATFYLGSVLMALPIQDGVYVKAEPAKLEQRSKEARALLEKTAATDLELPPPGEGYPTDYFKKRASGMLFELDRLQVGMKVPEQEAVDQDGHAFKLSDYRGTVVVIDFWGFWCSDCMQMLPQLRQLASKFEQDPFALIGVNSDGKVEDIKPKLAEKGVNWRQAIDVDPFGPWATRWNVTAWPMSYVIDQNGVIRASGHLGVDEIEKKVAELLPAKKKPGG